MNTDINSVFRSLDVGLYQGTSLEEIINLTCNELLNIGSIDSINRSNFLSNYHETISNKSNKRKMESMINTIIAKLTKKTLSSIPFEIAFRPKHLVSLWEKMEKYFQEDRDYLDILDILGIRIVIMHPNEHLSTNLVAEVADDILDLANLCKWSIIPLSMKIDNFDCSNFPHIILPTNDVRKEHLPYSKNYCLHPKSNGYQSLHLNVMPNHKIHAEIQIRTWLQNDYCEKLKNLNHKEYKEKEYKNSRYSYEIEKIPSIAISPTGSILDTDGIIEPIFPIKKFIA